MTLWYNSFIRNIFHFDRTERMAEKKNEIYVKIMQPMIKHLGLGIIYRWKVQQVKYGLFKYQLAKKMLKNKKEIVIVSAGIFSIYLHVLLNKYEKHCQFQDPFKISQVYVDFCDS